MVHRPTRLANCTLVPLITSHTGLENFPQPRPLKMKVTEKLDQVELSISSWDCSEWAPNEVDMVAVRAKQKAGQSLRGIARDVVSVPPCW